ncbi:unnamed protein product [Pleuronectes platessa]|uniref:Uncharacterized protein n=1 Tax=Pleuronectes platessa TaxID=8262 RepID=A0A9N7V705_PLEPL|nr:unnamed protein product [Pleuronectes platessa]
MPSSPAAITVHGHQPSSQRSTIQTRRHSSPQSPSTAAHQDPSRATTAVLTHRPCPMPTRHRVRHQHHDQPTSLRIRHTGSNTAIHKPQSMVWPQRPWIRGCVPSFPDDSKEAQPGTAHHRSCSSSADQRQDIYPGHCQLILVTSVDSPVNPPAFPLQCFYTLIWVSGMSTVPPPSTLSPGRSLAARAPATQFPSTALQWELELAQQQHPSTLSRGDGAGPGCTVSPSPRGEGGALARSTRELTLQASVRHLN